MKRGFGVGLLLIFVALLGVDGAPILAGGGPYRPFRWSADSTRLLVDVNCYGQPERKGIYLLEIADGEISSGALVASSDFQFSFLPEAQSFVGSTIVIRERDFYKLDHETLSLHNLTPDIPPILLNLSERWSPNGEILSFQTEGNGKYVLNGVTGATRAVAVPIQHWLFDDTAIGDADGDLFVVNAATGETRNLTADVPDTSWWKVSPDGETLFVQTDDEDGDIYAVDIATGETRNLTADLPDTSGWRVSPDGETLLVETDEEDPALYAVDIATGETRILTANTPSLGDRFTWQLSADGETLIVRPKDEDGDLYAVDIASGETRNLTADIVGVADDVWAWSPDLETLYTRVFADQSNDLYALVINTGEVRNLTTTVPGGGWYSGFENYSNIVLFKTDDALYVLDSDTREALNLSATVPIEESAYWSTWSPDGVLLLPLRDDPAAVPGSYSVGSLSIYAVPRHVGFFARSLSPDGSLFAVDDCSAEFGVRIINLDDAPND